MGGTETLILRLLEYYKNNDHRVILLTVTPIHKSILEDTNRVEFEHYIYNEINSDFFNDNAKLSFEKTEQPLVITQFLPEFLKCFTILRRSKYGVNFKHILYIVHPYSTFFGPKALTFLAKVMIKILLNRKALVFMDEISVETCIEHYGLKRSLNFKIFRLPILINENTDIIKRNKVFNVLAIARFEFPFKGYVLGLINSFAQLSLKYPSSSLTIIGHGKGKIEVDNLLGSLEQTIASKIFVLGEVPYHKINDYVSGCDVYVGMGTTVLDAANNNKITITAVAYQMKNLAVGFFHENYETVGEILVPDVKYPTFDELLETVLTAPDDEFEKMAKKSKEMLRAHYNINFIGSGLLNYTEKYLSFAEVLLIDMLAYIHLFSVKLIEKIRS